MKSYRDDTGKAGGKGRAFFVLATESIKIFRQEIESEAEKAEPTTEKRRFHNHLIFVLFSLLCKGLFIYIIGNRETR